MWSNLLTFFFYTHTHFYFTILIYLYLENFSQSLHYIFIYFQKFLLFNFLNFTFTSLKCVHVYTCDSMWWELLPAYLPVTQLSCCKYNSLSTDCVGTFIMYLFLYILHVFLSYLFHCIDLPADFLQVFL